jgi:Subtilase family
MLPELMVHAMRRQFIMQAIGLTTLCRSVPASCSPVVALIDGAVDTKHRAFADGSIQCDGHTRQDFSSRHATAMASVVLGQAPSMGAGRGSHLLAFDAVDDAALHGAVHPAEVASRIAQKIVAACDCAAKVILLGFEFLQDSPSFVSPLMAALEHVRSQQAAVLAPSGNTSRPYSHPLLKHPNVFPVAPAADTGEADSEAGWGPLIASGFLAPGRNVPVAADNNGVKFASGSSFATALAGSVCAALLARVPHASPTAICHAMRISGEPRSLTVPPSVNAFSAYRIISPL